MGDAVNGCSSAQADAAAQPPLPDPGPHRTNCRCSLPPLPADKKAAKLPDLEAMIRAFQVAMTDEEVPASVIRRVVNRVMYGDPCGPSCVRTVDESAGITVHVHTQQVNAAQLAREVHKTLLQWQRNNGGRGLGLLR